MTVGELRARLVAFPDEMEVTALQDLNQSKQAEFHINRVYANSVPKGTVFVCVSWKQTS